MGGIERLRTGPRNAAPSGDASGRAGDDCPAVRRPWAPATSVFAYAEPPTGSGRIFFALPALKAFR